MIIRAALVVAIVAFAAFMVWAWERRKRTESGLNAGITVVTATDCRLCPLAVAAAAGSAVRVTIVDINDVADRSIRSVPTAMVADRSGKMLASRSGRSAVTDMGALIDMAEASA
jgi:hypothetical protein